MSDTCRCGTFILPPGPGSAWIDGCGFIHARERCPESPLADAATLRKHAEQLAAAVALSLEGSRCYCGEERCGVCARTRALAAWRSGPGAGDGEVGDRG